MSICQVCGSRGRRHRCPGPVIATENPGKPPGRHRKPEYLAKHQRKDEG